MLKFKYTYCVARKYEITLIVTGEVHKNPFHVDFNGRNWLELKTSRSLPGYGHQGIRGKKDSLNGTHHPFLDNS